VIFGYQFITLPEIQMVDCGRRGDNGRKEPLKIFNTLSLEKEAFKPLAEEVRIYVCGVTPYDACHIGHAMSYIIFDVIRRYLVFRGYRIRTVQNFTDIDDKIINRANALGITADELAQKFIDQFYQDTDALNITRADEYPRATREIGPIIELVKGLIEKGYAYEARESIYYRVQKDPDYGKLAHRTLDMMMAGARIEPGEEKEHPMDFALWKAAKPGEPFWESPWGKGRPGWHIECSAMALKYLGTQLDIHGGGQDLIFPHHENEIAQSEAYTGRKPFVRYWMHNGLLQLGGEKMSKSLGNLITIRQILEKYGEAASDALRIFVLTSHYRNPLTYSEEVLSGAEKGAERLRGALQVAPKAGGTEANLDTASFRERFITAMDDDFNTPQALAALFDLARETNRAASEGKNCENARETLRELSKVLGLTLKQPDRAGAADIAPFIALLMETRRDLRTAKQYGLADNIRLKLADLGISLEDTPQGTVWKRK
jgi:cysteinyl-tRNA synthetase